MLSGSYWHRLLHFAIGNRHFGMRKKIPLDTVFTDHDSAYTAT